MQVKSLFLEVEVTKSLSSNLLKRGYTVVKSEEKRVIDTNELIARKLERLRAVNNTRNEASEEGFTSGISATEIDVLFDEENPEEEAFIEGFAEAVPVYEGPSPEELIAQAGEEIAQMKQAAARELEAEKQRVLNEAKERGYKEGYDASMQELGRMQQELEAEKVRLEAWVEEQIDELEPRFIETITGIYEHVFRVDLKSYREILVFLITETLRKIDGTRDFIVHVSKDDYPYVGMQKKQILAAAGTANATIEIIEDVVLSKNECLIETSGGIFDCGLDTQLTELKKKLTLLSYERAAQNNEF